MIRATVFNMNKDAFSDRDEQISKCDRHTPEPEPHSDVRTRTPEAQVAATGRVCAGTATVRTPEDIEPVLRILLDALARHGFAARDIQSVQIAVREAIINALTHGHRGDPTKQVRLRYLINPLGLLTQVEDEGPGFRPDWVLHPPGTPAGSDKAGRGLRLMRQHVTEVRYNACGNCVTLVKRRSPGGTEPC